MDSCTRLCPRGLAFPLVLSKEKKSKKLWWNIRQFSIKTKRVFALVSGSKDINMRTKYKDFRQFQLGL